MVSAEEANKAGPDTDDTPKAGEHLLVQAGTGTGKSLAYLVPAVLHAVRTGDHVVVATATIALQRQLVERDLPLVADALEPLLAPAADLRDPQGPPPLPVPAPAQRRAVARRRQRRAVRAGARRRRSARTYAASAPGPRTPRPATATSSVPAPADRAWRRCRSPPTSASARPDARTPTTCFAEKAREAARKRRRRRHQPRDARDRRDRAASRCCPSTTSSSSTRRTSWSTGSPGPSPTSSPSGMVERAARRRQAARHPETVRRPAHGGGYLEDALTAAEPGRVEQRRADRSSTPWSRSATLPRTLIRLGKTAGDTGAPRRTADSRRGEQAAQVQAKAPSRRSTRSPAGSSAAAEHDVRLDDARPSAAAPACGGHRCRWPGCCATALRRAHRRADLARR